MTNYKSIWQNTFTEAQQALQSFMDSPVTYQQLEKISEEIVTTYRRGGTVFSCGNGGSHCDAMHFAEELTGRYRKDRAPLGALALGDPSHVTCVSNDYGFEHIFARQLKGLARPNDLLLVISTSGNSKNQIRAVETAKTIPIKTIALLGKTGGALREISDYSVIAPGANSDRIQEIHIKIVHTLVEIVERTMFPENYA
jgi:D-sedoheptulose 7-phosphate isomerase